MGDLTKNFSRHEFECPCCGECEMDPEFMDVLQKLRDGLGTGFGPVKGGGYRCETYNGGKTGSHSEGKAIDPNLSKHLYHKTLKAAFSLGFTGIGIKNKGGKYQLHLDTAREIPSVRPRPYVWTY